MALPSSGAISLRDVNVELGLSATAQISMGDSAVRTLFGIGGGAINMQNGRGKANKFDLTITSNQTSVDLRTLAINAGWGQTSEVTITIDSGVWISGSSPSVPALSVSGVYPGGLTIINNGYIVGMGGTGGSSSGGSGGTGGTALFTSAALTLTNNGTIAGGGGGGGAGRNVPSGATAGGGGGGRSGLINSTGGNRVGGAGTSSGAGGGGAGSGRWTNGYNWFYPGNGGAGGNWGANGSGGGSSYSGAGGSGGAGGNCVVGNNLITWTYLGTRYGALV